MIKILMLEDDIEYALLLSKYLNKYNLNITNYTDPFLALSININDFDLLILDLTLPSMDGLDVCKKISNKYDIPIIISSARSDVSDKVLGLQLGADDYISKPYDPQEMYARIISLLRRYNKIKEQKDEPLDKFTINEEKDMISFDTKELILTPAEFIILKLLIKNRGNTISKEQILYESDIFYNNSDSSLSVIISRLRKKIDDEIKIKSIRGVGYRLV